MVRVLWEMQAGVLPPHCSSNDFLRVCCHHIVLQMIFCRHLGSDLQGDIDLKTCRTILLKTGRVDFEKLLCVNAFMH